MLHHQFPHQHSTAVRHISNACLMLQQCISLGPAVDGRALQTAAVPARQFACVCLSAVSLLSCVSLCDHHCADLMDCSCTMHNAMSNAVIRILFEQRFPWSIFCSSMRAQWCTHRHVSTAQLQGAFISSICMIGPELTMMTVLTPMTC